MKPQKFTREERLTIAKEFSKKIRAKFKENLLAIGIYGSVARKTDQAYSDLEMLVILKKSGSRKALEGVYKGLKYEITLFTREEVKNKISMIDIDWPVTVGQYLKVIPLYDPKNIFADLVKEYKKVIKRDFKPYIAEAFSGDLFELFCKFLNAKERKDYQAMRFLIFLLCDMVTKFLGLLNRQYYHSATRRPQDAMKMPINFPSFVKLMKKSCWAR